MTRPAWFDETLFPFESRFLEVDGARIHYVDEGDGPVLLMLHGQPTWSFLFRHLVERLRDEFRCVALDYPGFGLSTAPPGYAFRIHEQVRMVEGFVQRLDLDAITPVGHDWGGPIGMALAVRHPERVRAFVIGNTWAWPADKLAPRAFSLIMGGPAGHILVRRLNVFGKVFLRKGMTKRTLTEAEHAMYLGPHPTPTAREPVHTMPREIRAARPLLAEIESGIQRVADRPALIVWPTEDGVFGAEELQRWQETFDDHETVMLEGAGHYLWEDDPDAIAAAIRDWHPQTRRGRDRVTP